MVVYLLIISLLILNPKYELLSSWGLRPDNVLANDQAI